MSISAHTIKDSSVSHTVVIGRTSLLVTRIVSLVISFEGWNIRGSFITSRWATLLDAFLLIFVVILSLLFLLICSSLTFYSNCYFCVCLMTYSTNYSLMVCCFNHFFQPPILFHRHQIAQQHQTFQSAYNVT